jgi:ectoine hydroxylase-related dioxygenase (phytanoyl-CoA dioxygenase family)
MLNLQNRVTDLWQRANRKATRDWRGVRRASPSWTREANALPWLDRPDAREVLEARVERGEFTAQEGQLLRKWLVDGYVVLDECYPADEIESMIATLDQLWEADRPINGLTLLDLREEEGQVPRNISHADLLRLDPVKRLHMRDVSNWRIHGFQRQNMHALNIYRNRKVREMVSTILGRPAEPIASINFMFGSQQALHQDMAVFHIYPHNYLVGAWLACQDIDPASGPLVFYAGSHREPLYAGFEGYPQVNLRTADAQLTAAYQDYAARVAQTYERKTFLGKKGQVLLWHGMLIHGGEPIQTRGIPRKSMVVHYSVPGANKTDEITGPVNW